MEKKKILLDVDEVICFSGFLNAINEFLNTNYVIDDFTDYYLDEAAIPKERMPEFNKYINQKNMYENAFILPDAIEVLNKLNEVYDIYICSSCVNPFDIEGSGRIFADKYNFLMHTLPFIKPERYIFTSSKHLFKADIQIDDRINNFDSDIKTKILFSSYHNMNIPKEKLLKNNVTRAGDNWRTAWKDIEKLLLNSLEQ